MASVALARRVLNRLDILVSNCYLPKFRGNSWSWTIAPIVRSATPARRRLPISPSFISNTPVATMASRSKRARREESGSAVAEDAADLIVASASSGSSIGAAAVSVAPLRSTFRSCVKIFATHLQPHYALPWTMKRETPSTSSGFIISGRRILTNAHSVAYATSVHVRLHGSAEKVLARVLTVSHDCDVALLTVDDEDFWTGRSCLELADGVPQLHDSCVVVGFPLGGEQISITAGVVSRVDFSEYAHSSASNLLVQTDGAINSGNSGGPVLNGAGQVVGIAFQAIDSSQAEAVGYFIPCSVVRHVLRDYEATGRALPNGRLGFYFQTMEADSLRAACSVPVGKTGVLVTRTVPISDAAKRVQPYDVLCAVDGHAVANDGTVAFREDERLPFGWLLSEKSVGETVELSLLRGGKPTSVTCVLEDVPDLVPSSLYDQRPQYIAYGGLVFTPLTEPYLAAQYTREWEARAPVRLVHSCFHGSVDVAGQQVVLLSQILANAATVGYDPDELTGLPLVSVNGVRIYSMADLVEVLAFEDDATEGAGAGAGAGAAAGGAGAAPAKGGKSSTAPTPRARSRAGSVAATSADDAAAAGAGSSSGAGAVPAAKGTAKSLLGKRSAAEVAAAGSSSSAAASGGAGAGAAAAAGSTAAATAAIGAAAGASASAPSSIAAAAAARARARDAAEAAKVAAARAAPLLRFELAEGKIVVMSREAGRAATADCLRTHAIPSPLSADLRALK